nr:GntR family transcriptional regulator [Spirilliplanes yamanashiensis]
MRLHIDPAAAAPPYEQVRAQIADQAGDGRLPAGAKLPPVRALAAELGLAANTVARAYRELEQAGLVETRGRGGTVVTARAAGVPAEARRLAEQYAQRVTALGVAPATALELARGALGLPA